ncbi:MAG: 23S rRNA (pseudouridine(1915)-N(3))-methyltransferase RlmH [Rhodomicrobium sp.]|nr:23S rRNA (pseudouridine(1915)-N(3))-methyltransferase RlmH [Rhodomicrobium sp.]
MKIEIICIGRLKEEAESQIVARYIQRFSPVGGPLGFGAIGMTEIGESKARTAAQRMAAEAAEISRKISAGAHIVACDRNGKTLDSQTLADYLARLRDDGARLLYIVIGGPDGLDPSIKERAGLTLSFGRMTLPHGLARAVLAEQLYRAATILAGHPYHRA